MINCSFLDATKKFRDISDEHFVIKLMDDYYVKCHFNLEFVNSYLS